MFKLILTVLGSAAATPSHKYYTSGILLSFEKEQWLIDCGEGIQVPFFRYGGNLNKLSRIFISHLHVDHYIGIIGLLMSLHIQGRQAPVFIYAPHGFEDILVAVLRASHTQLRYRIEYIPLEENSDLIYEDDKWRVKAFRLVHRLPTWGFRIDQQYAEYRFMAKQAPANLPYQAIRMLKRGYNYTDLQGKEYKATEYTCPLYEPVSFVYCSDTAYSPTLIKHCRLATLLYHETTFLHQDHELAAKTYHSTTLQAAKLAHESQVQNLLIGHFSHRYADRSLFLEETRSLFERSIMAQEGMTIDLIALGKEQFNEKARLSGS